MVDGGSSLDKRKKNKFLFHAILDDYSFEYMVINGNCSAKTILRWLSSIGIGIGLFLIGMI